MRLVVTNLTNTAYGPLIGLPDGGVIKAGVNTVSTFELGVESLDEIRAELSALIGADSITVSLKPSPGESDFGARLYRQQFRVTGIALAAAAVTETLIDSFAFPANAVLIAYMAEVAEVFAGGTVSAATVDVGIGAGAEGDLLSDGLNVFTGQTLGRKFTSGANAVGGNPLALGGKALRVKVDAVDGNVAALTSGDLTVTVLYATI